MKTNGEAHHRAAALALLGDMLRRRRQSGQWSQFKLSEKTGIDIVTISAVELGEDVASEGELELLCAFLGMKVDTFSKLLANSNREQKDVQRHIEALGSNIVDLEKRRSQCQKITSRPEA